jgi:hypothetical protein
MAGLSGSPGGRRRGSEWPSGQLTVRVAGVAGRAAVVTTAGQCVGLGVDFAVNYVIEVLANYVA